MDIQQKIAYAKSRGLDKKFERARVLTNLAYVLADVTNSVVMDAEDNLSCVGVGLRHEDKRNFNRMRDALKNAVTASKTAASIIYKVDDADSACIDSDYYYHVIMAICEKTKDSTDNAMKIAHFLNDLK